MPSKRRASALMALLGILLLVVMMPCTTGAVVAATEDTATTTTGYIDYFLGDLFSMNHNTGPKAPPRFRPWLVIDVPYDSVLAFDCVGDVPTLRVVRYSDDYIDNTDGTTPPTDKTCGVGAKAGMLTPTQYKFTKHNGTAARYSVLFWGQQPATVEEGEGAPPQLMPVPKFHLKAILKAVAAMMDSSWMKERGDEKAMPESVAFTADMVVFYFNRGGWLVAMGREDVEFRQPWERQRLIGEIKIKPLNLGTVV